MSEAILTFSTMLGTTYSGISSDETYRQGQDCPRDALVTGQDPEIDWQRRTIAERKGAHGTVGNRELPDHRIKTKNETRRGVMMVSTKLPNNGTKQADRGGYNDMRESEAIADYEKERQEVEHKYQNPNWQL